MMPSGPACWISSIVLALAERPIKGSSTPRLVSIPLAEKPWKRGAPSTLWVSHRNAFHDHWWKAQLLLNGKGNASGFGVWLCGNQLDNASQEGCCALAPRPTATVQARTAANPKSFARIVASIRGSGMQHKNNLR